MDVIFVCVMPNTFHTPNTLREKISFLSKFLEWTFEKLSMACIVCTSII